jgi:hypothetical protein
MCQAEPQSLDQKLFQSMSKYILCTIYLLLLNCCWPSPAQWFLVLSLAGPMTIFYCLMAYDHTIYLLSFTAIYIVTCCLKARIVEHRICLLLGNGSVNIFPWQWIHTQQQKNLWKRCFLCVPYWGYITRTKRTKSLVPVWRRVRVPQPTSCRRQRKGNPVPGDKTGPPCFWVK